MKTGCIFSTIKYEMIKGPITKYKIHGSSMYPTLKSGQDVLSINWFVNPKVGDIVIVNRLQVTGYREIIKRVVKIEGDKVFVAGDNQNESTDSRDFGAVSMDQIVGKVIWQSSHPEFISGSLGIPKQVRNDEIPCPNCASPVIGIYGRKDALCRNCGFKMICCGE